MYALYALLGRSAALVNRPLELPSATVVHLDRGIGMIPLTESLLDEIRQAEEQPATSIAPFEFLWPAVAEWASRLSRSTVIAYVEAEYISGEGAERAIVWCDGAATLEPLSEIGAIRRALRALGVRATGTADEFELVGLGRFRSPGEWLVRFD